jgi:hypothetical protein
VTMSVWLDPSTAAHLPPSRYGLSTSAYAGKGGATANLAGVCVRRQRAAKRKARRATAAS